MGNKTDFFKWAIPDLFFVYFCSFQAILQSKNFLFDEILTRIIGVEGEHADH